MRHTQGMHAKIWATLPLAITLSFFAGTHLYSQSNNHVAYAKHHTVTYKRVATTTKPVQRPVTVAPTPAATAPVAIPTTDFAVQVEQLVHTKINAERSKVGLATLALDSTLAIVARAHSADMAKNNYFNHTNLAGCSSSCRVTNAGYQWSTVGENIYMMSGYKLSADATAQMIVDGWMNSPGHKANIVNTNFTYEGIGVAQVGNSLYATEDFARPR